MMRKPKPMSKAQLEFMKEHLPAYIVWLKATGQSIGIKMKPWQERIVKALIRNGHLTEDGHVTERGMKGYERKFSVILPRFDHPIKGATADTIIIDDPVETTV
jgi:hypothetical protein